MSRAPTTTVWDASPHTIAKQRILGKYLAGWMPTLTVQGFHGRVLVIDGFCGPGEYRRGEEGSPIIALRTYLGHQARHKMEQCEFVFWFIDNDADRLEYLEHVAVPKLGQLPENVTVRYNHAAFDEHMSEMLDSLQERGTRLAPTFAFVDPFGFSDTPMSIIRRVLEHPRSEVLITVMLEYVNRFLKHPNSAIATRWDELFGDVGWRELVERPDRLNALGDFYAMQLRRSARYVTSFRMLDEGERPIYDLFFGSNHLDGLRKMKRAMWNVNPTGGFSFSDRDSTQLSLFDKADTTRLRSVLLKRFKGRTVSLREVEEWILTETTFHDGHIKRMTLGPLEKDGLIKCIPPRAKSDRRAGTFPDGSQIEFH
jgi:three-Cys-motif partner protein